MASKQTRTVSPLDANELTPRDRLIFEDDDPLRWAKAAAEAAFNKYAHLLDGDRKRKAEGTE